MAGLKGQVRIPNANQDPRVRRNSVNLASVVSFISADSVISIDGDGILQVDIDADGGLTNTTGELGILLAGPELALSSNGLAIGTSLDQRRHAEQMTAAHTAIGFAQEEVDEARTEFQALHDQARAIAFFQGRM